MSTRKKGCFFSLSAVYSDSDRAVVFKTSNISTMLISFNLEIAMLYENCVCSPCFYCYFGFDMMERKDYHTS